MGKARINGIYRYPVKGLSPEPLDEARLNVGKVIAHDREWAIEAGTGRFEAADPRHYPKINFLMLMRDEALAGLTTRYQAETQELTIEKDGKQILSLCLAEADQRAQAEEYFSQFMPEGNESMPRIVKAEGFSFSDLNDQVISVINLASLRAMEEAAGVKVHPLRFRANLYLEGLEPWAEMDWVEQKLECSSGACLTGVKITRRCPAINVNPVSAERDVDLNRVLMDAFGHPNCGIYMQVNKAGNIAVGDALTLT